MTFLFRLRLIALSLLACGLASAPATADEALRLIQMRSHYDALRAARKYTSPQRETAGANRTERIQRALNILSYAVGPANGKKGYDTREGIRRFQNDFGFGRSTSVSTAQYQLMRDLAQESDLRYHLHKVPEGAYKGLITGKIHETLIPHCRLSRKSKFGEKSERDAIEECGYVDAEGRWVIPPVFHTVYPFRGKVGLVTLYSGKYEGYWLIDRRGFFLHDDPLQYAYEIRSPHNWYACVAKSKCGVLPSQGGDWLIPPNYRDARQISPGVFSVSDAQDSYFIWNTKTGKKLRGDYIGSSTVTFGKQYLTSKDDTITIFGDGKDPAKLKYRGWLQSDCKDRLIINASGDTGKSWLYKPQNKRFVSVDGFFRVPGFKAVHCDNILIVRSRKGHASLLDIREEKLFKKFDDLNFPIFPSPFIRTTDYSKNRTVTRYGVIDKSGLSVVPTRFYSAAINIDGTILLQDSPFSFKLVRPVSKGGKWTLETIASNILGNAAHAIAGQPGYYKVMYGNVYRYAGGSYVISPKGKIISDTARHELDLFVNTCRALLGNIAIENAPKIRSCEEYIEMRALGLGPSGKASGAAQFTFAYMQEGGADKAAFRKWLERAGNNGFRRAQTDLGFRYGEGDAKNGFSRNQSKAARWANMAAAAGDEVSQYNLYILYLNGRHYKQDYDKAYYWVRRSAAQGYPEAIKEKRRMDDAYAALSAARRQQARSMTLNDVWNNYIEPFVPSRAEIERDRAIRKAKDQCRSNQRACYKSCQNLSSSRPTVLVYSPYEKCRIQCGKYDCN